MPPSEVGAAALLLTLLPGECCVPLGAPGWFMRTSVIVAQIPRSPSAQGDGDAMVPIEHVVPVAAVVEVELGRPPRPHRTSAAIRSKRVRGSCEVGRKWRSKHSVGSTDPTI